MGYHTCGWRNRMTSCHQSTSHHLVPLTADQHASWLVASLGNNSCRVGDLGRWSGGGCVDTPGACCAAWAASLADAHPKCQVACRTCAAGQALSTASTSTSSSQANGTIKGGEKEHTPKPVSSVRVCVHMLPSVREYVNVSEAVHMHICLPGPVKEPSNVASFVPEAGLQLPTRPDPEHGKGQTAAQPSHLTQDNQDARCQEPASPAMCLMPLCRFTQTIMCG